MTNLSKNGEVKGNPNWYILHWILKNATIRLTQVFWSK